MGRQALPLPGDARVDLWLIQEIARRIGLGWNYASAARGLRRDGLGDAVARQHHLGALARESRSPIPCRRPGHSPATMVCSARVSRPRRAAPSWCRRESCRRPRMPEPGVSVRADHRAAARALAHRRDDPPRRRARRARARRRWCRRPGRRCAKLGLADGDMVRVDHAPRHDRARMRAPTPARRRACFIPFAFGEAAANLLTNPTARPVRQDPRIQVLRRPDRGSAGRGPVMARAQGGYRASRRGRASSPAPA